MRIKALTEALSWRARLANIAGKTFGGRRDLYTTLGYNRQLFPEDYRARYRRNEVANRIVKARPAATWRGGADIVEDMNPAVETAFEAAFVDLDRRLKIWDTFKRADILAGIGRYAVILIGAPGELEAPLETASATELAYLQAYAEEDAIIERYEVDRHSPRFGRPIFYTVKRTQISGMGTNPNSLGVGRRVHWTRVTHVADGLLDDQIFGEPRLECVWNRLDDLEKVAGGGAEAFWRRADMGVQFDIDPTLDVGQPEKDAMKAQLEEYEHDLRRYLLTRGMTINQLGSEVTDFKSPVESIISLISAGTGIPQRVLMGSEQGKLAAKQDRVSWDNAITDRQNDFAGPCIVRPFVDRLLELGALPVPKSYDVVWSTLTTMDDEQRSKIATEWAALNDHGDLVVTSDEVRERVLRLAPLTPEQRAAWEKIRKTTGTAFNENLGRFNQADFALINVLEAALEHDKPAVIERLLGVKLTDANTTSEVIREIKTIEMLHPELVQAFKTLAEREQLPPVVHVNVEAAPVPEVTVNVEAPVPPDVRVNVEATQVRVEPPVVHVAAPQVHVAAPQVHVEAPPLPEIKVEVQPPNVQVSVPPLVARKTRKRVERDPKTNLVIGIVEE